LTIEGIIEYCLQCKYAYVDFPFGDMPMCIKVHGKIFAQIYGDKVTLKCERIAGEYYLATYKKNTAPGYHCPPVQRPYFITIYFEPVMPDEVLKEMVGGAYNAVIKKLPRKIQKELVQS